MTWGAAASVGQFVEALRSTACAARHFLPPAAKAAEKDYSEEDKAFLEKKRAEEKVRRQCRR